MKFEINRENDVLYISLNGRFDAAHSAELDATIKKNIDGVTKLIFDFAKLEYVSSSGLRVILSAQKIMNKQGTMLVRHPNSIIMEIFEMTGFLDILTIEN